MHINFKKVWNKIIEFFKSIFSKDDQTEPDIPDPVPVPDPDPVPSEDFDPPARTGSQKYTGTGTWNQFKDAGRNKESSHSRVEVSGWFKAKSWSGGNKEQAAGFSFANKGKVGSHWGINFTVRPNALVWNATKGEVLAKCNVALNTWNHVKAVAVANKVDFWFNGKKLVTEKQTFAGALISDSGEPLRIGGYYTDYKQATWFNQSLNGELSDWKVEMK